MKLSELQKKIADVLGVSGSQKELSFEIFLNKISEILLEQITLKVPRIGFFQLKNVPGKNGNRPLIFSPLSENIHQDTRNLYLTIDVTHKKRNTPEFDSNIFSIGVGKPLLPLAIDELPDAETSYAMLRKSIEERVKELLMESDQIPNFNIWDDYYKSTDDFEDEPNDDARSQLSKLTADLDFKEEIIPDKISENILGVSDLPLNSRDQLVQQDVPNESGIQEEPFNPSLFRYEEDKIETDSNRDTIPEEGVLNKSDEFISVDEDFSALENLQFSEDSKEQLTISELLEDDDPLKKEPHTTKIEEPELEEYGVPTKETIEKILAGEDGDARKSKDENDDFDLSLQKDSEDEDFYNLSGVEISLAKNVEFTSDGTLIEDVEEGDINKDEISQNDLTPQENSSFEALHQLTGEATLHEENGKDSIEDLHKLNDEATPTDANKENSFEELQKLDNEVTTSDENEEDSFEEAQTEEEEEKIEWNWGDELREEFGIPSEEGEDAKFEMLSNRAKENDGGVELIDDFTDEEKTTKDLFYQLEKTIERELKFDEEPRHRLTVEDNKPTLGKNKLKKVVLEFSGPPAKYEFVEERQPEKERRMAISLVDESGEKVSKQQFGTDEEIIESSKDSYFGKMFLIIFGAFIVVATVVVFIVINGNKSDKSKNETKSVEQVKTNLASDSANADTDTQSQLSKNSSTFDNDDLSDFPRTATPPVPIKDATDKQILETIKNESAKLQSSKKENTPQTASQKNVKPENQGLYKTVAIDTKISNRVFYDGRNYNLQISSWPNRTRAEQEVNRLRDVGFNAFIVQADLPQKGGIWYRVRVGPFKSEKEADEFLRKNNF
jgi:cell division septation protein DedD